MWLNRSASKDLVELHDHIASMVQKINTKYGTSNYEPIVFLERPVPLYEKIALYSISDVCVVTATRDGMNLVPYEYIVCRQAIKVRLVEALLDKVLAVTISLPFA